MSEKKDRKFVGSGVQTNEYYTNLSLDMAQLEENAFEYNGKKYVRVTVGKKREIDQYGKTHSVWINNYEPKGESKQEAPKIKGGDGLPF